MAGLQTSSFWVTFNVERHLNQLGSTGADLSLVSSTPANPETKLVPRNSMQDMSCFSASLLPTLHLSLQLLCLTPNRSRNYRFHAAWESGRIKHSLAS